jgi:hypothetical protein
MDEPLLPNRGLSKHRLQLIACQSLCVAATVGVILYFSTSLRSKPDGKGMPFMVPPPPSGLLPEHWLAFRDFDLGNTHGLKTEILDLQCA